MKDLELARSCEDLTKYAYVALRRFPKSERHVLSQELRNGLWRMRRTLKRLRASYAAGHIGLARIREHITSWLGHVRNASSYHSRRRVLASVSFRRAT